MSPALPLPSPAPNRLFPVEPVKKRIRTQTQEKKKRCYCGRLDDFIFLLVPKQSPPSQSHAELLQALSQYPSLIQEPGQPSAQLGTGQVRYTCRQKTELKVVFCFELAKCLFLFVLFRPSGPWSGCRSRPATPLCQTSRHR